VAGSCAVQGVAVPVGVEADQVECGGREDVLEASFWRDRGSGSGGSPAIRDGLADGALTPARGRPACQSIPIRAARAVSWAWWTSRGQMVS